jgi:hypothetical protein
MKILMLSRVFVVLCSIEASSAFCDDEKYLHPSDIAGQVCFKENNGVTCDSNVDELCTKENCEIQMGGLEEYTCGFANFHYDNPDEEGWGKYDGIVDIWKEKCCSVEPVEIAGCLGGGTVLDFSGECSYEKILEKARAEGCTKENLFGYLKVGNESAAEDAMENLCNDAYSEYVDSFFHFSDIAKSGYQFDREFMNGGSDWINTFNPDMSRIQWVQDNVLTKEGIKFPEYLYNFNTEESCDSNAVMCCWIADSTAAGSGSCSEPAGCQDEEPLDNTDICLVDIEDSPLASHIASGIAIYSGDAEGAANCKGFTWKNDTHSDLYKGNLLFEVAMRYGLKDNGYTRSVPHAPMCACIEQMPYVSHADCIDLESESTWSVFPDSETGLLAILHNNANIEFNDCNGAGLAEHYETVHSESTISDRIDDCSNIESSVFDGLGFKKEDRFEWIKVAGKGEYAEAGNPKFTDQLNDGDLTSMSREDFEELWAKSSHQLLLRECKYCVDQHKLIYYKRYDENGLPSNVDLLYDVKEHWTSYENSTWQTDWNLFSSADDALADKEPWERVNYDFKDHYGNWVGFPRDASPYDGHMHNQWNIWDKPIWNTMYGQQHVAFYVGISPDTNNTQIE